MTSTSTAVEVEVIVQSPRGDYVQGLEASDFKLYENDVPQKITLFVPPDEVGRNVTNGQPPPSTSPDSEPGARSSAAQDDQSERREAQLVTLVLDLADLQQS